MEARHTCGGRERDAGNARETHYEALQRRDGQQRADSDTAHAHGKHDGGGGDATRDGRIAKVPAACDRRRKLGCDEMRVEGSGGSSGGSMALEQTRC